MDWQPPLQRSMCGEDYVCLEMHTFVCRLIFVWICKVHNNGKCDLFPFLFRLSVKGSALLRGWPLLRLLAGSGLCLAWLTFGMQCAPVKLKSKFQKGGGQAC